MDLLYRKTQFQTLCRKVYRKVQEANHRSISYRIKYRIARPLQIGQKVLLENCEVPFGKSLKICELRSGRYILTKVLTKANDEIDIDSDPTKTQVVQRNDRVQFFPRGNELVKLQSNCGKPFNDIKAEHFNNEYEQNWLFQLNPPIDSVVERQHLHDYFAIFPDGCGTLRKDTCFISHVKDNSCHSTPNVLASSHKSGIPQSSSQTLLSFPLESPVITSQPTKPSLLPCTSSNNHNNFQSTSTGTTPLSRSTRILRIFPREWYSKPYF